MTFPFRKAHFFRKNLAAWLGMSCLMICLWESPLCFANPPAAPLSDETLGTDLAQVARQTEDQIFLSQRDIPGVSLGVATPAFYQTIYVYLNGVLNELEQNRAVPPKLLEGAHSYREAALIDAPEYVRRQMILLMKATVYLKHLRKDPGFRYPVNSRINAVVTALLPQNLNKLRGKKRIFLDFAMLTEFVAVYYAVEKIGAIPNQTLFWTLGIALLFLDRKVLEKTGYSLGLYFAVLVNALVTGPFRSLEIFPLVHHRILVLQRPEAQMNPSRFVESLVDHNLVPGERAVSGAQALQRAIDSEADSLECMNALGEVFTSLALPHGTAGFNAPTFSTATEAAEETSAPAMNSEAPAEEAISAEALKKQSQ